MGLRTDVMLGVRITTEMAAAIERLRVVRGLRSASHVARDCLERELTKAGIPFCHCPLEEVPLFDAAEEAIRKANAAVETQQAAVEQARDGFQEEGEVPSPINNHEVPPDAIVPANIDRTKVFTEQGLHDCRTKARKPRHKPTIKGGKQAKQPTREKARKKV
jgi:hypothetical protein